MYCLTWSIQSEAKCSLCDSQHPTTAHVLSSCPAAPNQLQYNYCHDQVLSVLTTKFTEVFVNFPFTKIFADLPNFHADNFPSQQFHLVPPLSARNRDIQLSESIHLFIRINLPSGFHI